MQELMIPGADGISSYVVDFNAVGVETGPPVICLHGLTRNHKDFRDLIEPLQRLGRRVIALDVRGRGRSDRDPNPSNYNPLIYVQDLMAIMARLGIARATFIGTSMGGLMTMVLASFAPHMIASAVLNDIGPEVDPAGIKRIQNYVAKTTIMRNWDEAALTIQGIGSVAYPNRDFAFWLDLAKRNMVEADGGIIFDYDPAIANFAAPPSDGPAPTMWEQFKGFKDIPTAVIRGGLSDLLSSDIVARMKEAKPDLITAEVPNVGHAPMLTEPQAWAAIEAIVRITK
jgi:pimeloyl-ACP methyl ester carboxylesterase